MAPYKLRENLRLPYVDVAFELNQDEPICEKLVHLVEKSVTRNLAFR
jgi:hypothetical protein